MNEGQALILFVGSAPKKSADAHYPYFANRNFYYLTGILQSESIFLAVKNEGHFEETLFVHTKGLMSERWHVARISHEEASERSGIANIRDLADLDSILHGLLASGKFQSCGMILTNTTRRHGCFAKPAQPFDHTRFPVRDMQGCLSGDLHGTHNQGHR